MSHLLGLLESRSMGRSRRFTLRTGVVICVLITAGLQGTGGGGSPAAADSPQPTVVSVPDPFAPLDCGQAVGVFRSRNSPREPVVAVNPTNPSNVVVSYIVDNNLSNLIRVSRDGGRTWQTVMVPGISACTGAPNAGAADPSLAFSADGKTLYLATLTLPAPAPGTDGVVVSTSTDGGFTWSARPTALSAPDGLWGDKNLVTSDPLRPQTAYVMFERHDYLTNSVSTLYFRRTDDGGVTWSPAVAVYRPPTGNLSAGNAQVLRSGSGSLVIVFDRIVTCPAMQCLDPAVVEDNIVYASTSTDEGKSWSEPVKIGNRTAGPGTARTECGDLAASLQSTVGPDGTVFVSFPVDAHTEALPLATDLVVFKSRDGTSWSQAASIAAPTVIGMPTIAVARDGTVGMTYYQLEKTACPAPDAVDPVDVWYARSRDAGQSWVMVKIAGPFDARGNCFFPGTPLQVCEVADYDGLQPAGAHGFAAVFEIPRPRGQQQSDIVYAALSSSPSQGPKSRT